MTTYTAGGKPLLTATIHELTSGRWFADVEIDTTIPPSGQITLILGAGAGFTGTVARADRYAGKTRARVVGGADGLGGTVTAKAYRQVTFGVILDDLAADTGEYIETSTEIRARYTQLWHRSRGTGAAALRAITAHLGVTWRFLRGGQLWIGTDTWPSLTFDAVELDRDDGQGWVLYSPAREPTIQPGYTVANRRVDSVVTTLRAGALVQRAMYRKGTSTAALDRLRYGMAAFIDTLLGRSAESRARWDHMALYPCTVDAQAGDGTLDLRPDDIVVSGSGLSGIPLRTGLPGWEVSVPSGTRVLLGFEGGDPSRPFALLWEHESDIDELVFDGGSQGVARISDSVDGGTVTATALFGGSPIVFTYIPSGGGAPVVSQTMLMTGGKITSGSSKLKA